MCQPPLQTLKARLGGLQMAGFAESLPQFAVQNLTEPEFGTRLFSAARRFLAVARLDRIKDQHRLHDFTNPEKFSVYDPDSRKKLLFVGLSWRKIIGSLNPCFSVP